MSRFRSIFSSFYCLKYFMNIWYSIRISVHITNFYVCHIFVNVLNVKSENFNFRPKLNVINCRRYLIVYAWSDLEKKEIRVYGTFTCILNHCKQIQDTSLVYATKNSEFCILLNTLRRTLTFWLIIKNAFLKNFQQ